MVIGISRRTYESNNEMNKNTFAHGMKRPYLERAKWKLFVGGERLFKVIVKSKRNYICSDARHNFPKMKSFFDTFICFWNDTFMNNWLLWRSSTQSYWSYLNYNLRWLTMCVKPNGERRGDDLGDVRCMGRGMRAIEGIESWKKMDHGAFYLQSRLWARLVAENLM